MERRPAGVEPAVAPDDVRDGFGPDSASRPLGVVADVEVEQGVRVPSLCETHGGDIGSVAEETKPRGYRATQHYEEFVVRGLLGGALLEPGEGGLGRRVKPIIRAVRPRKRLSRRSVNAARRGIDAFR